MYKHLIYCGNVRKKKHFVYINYTHFICINTIGIRKNKISIDILREKNYVSHNSNKRHAQKVIYGVIFSET